jgi:hypothetical protein
VRSRNGFLAAAMLLLALPLAVLTQIILGTGSETVVHLVGAVGFVLLALSFFDFALPRWVALAGGAAAAGLAAIFALQGLASLLPESALHGFAFQVLGNLPERICINALVVCLFAVCVLDSQGRTRIFGVLSLLAVAAVELYRIVLLTSGSS